MPLRRISYRPSYLPPSDEDCIPGLSPRQRLPDRLPRTSEGCLDSRCSPRMTRTGAAGARACRVEDRVGRRRRDAGRGCAQAGTGEVVRRGGDTDADAECEEDAEGEDPIRSRGEAGPGDRPSVGRMLTPRSCQLLSRLGDLRLEQFR